MIIENEIISLIRNMFVFCRFYMNRKGLCSIQMVDAEFEYTYEYQGNAAKLVHTPLTDKCYLTLTQGQSPKNIEFIELFYWYI